MTVVSNAAVVKLTTPAPLLKSDPLLSLISALAPPNQVTLTIPKKGTSLSFEQDNGSTILTQRNVILRSICGMALHNALDKAPFYLLGGHSATSTLAPESSMVMAGMSSWMSVADSINSTKDVERATQICVDLDQILEVQSFLCSSTVAQVTLADLDVFFALVVSHNKVLVEQVQAGNVPNLKRWVIQCEASVKEMIANLPKRTDGKAPEVTFPDLDIAVAEPVPVFFYGDEGDDEIVTAAAPSKSAPDPSNNSGGSGKKPAGKDSKETNAASGGGGGGGELSEEQKKAAAEKRAKKNAEKAAKKAANKKNAGGGGGGKGTAAPAAELNVSALDIRIGKILEVWPHESSEKLWCEKVDVGEDEPRQILSGLRDFYSSEDMKDRTVLVLCNLKKRNLGGVPSHGMVLCASNKEHTSVEFVVPPEGAKIGERVMFDGCEGEAEAENKVAKKKIFEKLAPDLKTDGDGTVVWSGKKSSTSAGPCVASKGMKDAQVS